MRAYCVDPTDSLTWDDVCQLWDDGFYTTADVKSIATLYFDSAELSAVLGVIEDVENESQALEAMSTDPGDYDMQPAAMDIYIEIFERIEPDGTHDGLHIVLEPDRDNPWRGLH